MRRALIFLGLCAAALAGCSEVHHVRNPLEPGHELARLDSRIQLRLHENLSASGRTLDLLGETEKIYGCCNFSIVSELSRRGNLFEIRFPGIFMPKVCLTALGPATGSLRLGPTAEGIWLVELSANDTTVAAALAISRDSIQVVGGDGPWTTFPTSVLHRVPPATIWGLIGWDTNEQSTRAQAFLDSLVAIGARPVSLVPGDYGYFHAARDGTIELPNPSGYHFDRAFAYHYDGDRQRLPVLVQAFGDSLRITLNDDIGDTWYSWVLRWPS